MIRLSDYQEDAVERLRSGSILCGGVGSGKSLTSLAYFLRKQKEACERLYIITTAYKRDLKEWELEWAKFKDPGVEPVVDSWNNLPKYVDVQNAFFIFDEQKLLSYGAWSKAFLKIAKKNRWILLTATPGDTWLDYMVVFIANGFYKNKSEFIARHAVFKPYSRYPKIYKFVDQGYLYQCKEKVLVNMEPARINEREVNILKPTYDQKACDILTVKRWVEEENRPVRDAAELCYRLRKVVNKSSDRLEKIEELLKEHKRVIIFYNFDYELEILRFLKFLDIPVAEHNGHRHDPLPQTERWVYLVQYTAGAEGWNCIQTNCIIFYSLNYSYKIMKQASGRIDRLNTPFEKLVYYVFISDAMIDKAIVRSLTSKKQFNEKNFYSQILQLL